MARAEIALVRGLKVREGFPDRQCMNSDADRKRHTMQTYFQKTAANCP